MRRRIDSSRAAGELATANPDVVPEVLESYLATRDRSILENATKLVAKCEVSGAVTSNSGCA